MIRRMLRVALCFYMAFLSIRSVFADEIHLYVFFGRDRDGIRQQSFLETKAFEGAQLKYFWRELEPEKDRYDFLEIRKDLAYLTAHKKRLFIQLQDSTFDPVSFAVPAYLRTDPRFHGGVAPQYSLPKEDETHAVIAGWVARRWDSAVQERFHRLLAALGREFDGKIEGINLAETAVDFGESGRLFPSGFTPKGYQGAIIAQMKVLKGAFTRSVVMQYANFMPGEWLPYDDKSYLKSVYQQAAHFGVGVGVPDLLPYRKAQMNHSYPLLQMISEKVPTGVAVQDGNCEEINVKTGKRFTIAELLRFAKEYLRVKYVFWGMQEPYYSKHLIPFLNPKE